MRRRRSRYRTIRTRRRLALLLLATVAATVACGRAGPPVRRANPAPPAADESRADPSHSEPKDGDEEIQK